MHEAHENGQHFKTSGSNSPPRYQKPHHVIKSPTTLSKAPPRYQKPHHMEDLERQIPYSLEKT